MRQIAFAVELYELAYGHYPPAYTVDVNGNRLHSWRTLILPMVEQGILLEQIDLSQPWDAPVNQPHTGQPLSAFMSPSQPSGRVAFTSYVAVVGPQTMWPGESPRYRCDVKDPVGETLFIVEYAGNDIAWAEPRDLTLEELVAAFRAGDLTGICRFNKQNPNVAFVDLHMEYLDPSKLTEAEFIALFNIADSAGPAGETAP